jgi:hypothetical protein
MSDTLKDIEAQLQRKYQLACAVLEKLREIRFIYDNTTENIPRCSREHITYLVSDVTKFRDDVSDVMSFLPRVLNNKAER